MPSEPEPRDASSRDDRAPDALRWATTRADFEAFARLVTAYVAWFTARYREDPEFAERIFRHQSLAGELDALAQTYSPPHGKALVAERDGVIGAAVGLRNLGDSSCEMKRLYVCDAFKGRGLGRRLCEALIAGARADGYRLMRLDTGDRLTEAIGLYELLGFRRCAPHRAYPIELARHLVFMELALRDPM